MSELPFLKNKNQFGGGPIELKRNGSAALLEMMAEELMSALHRKDIKSLRDSLEALVLMINDKDREQDAAD